MSSIHEIDPRLRETAADANAYANSQSRSHRPSNATHPNASGPRPIALSPHPSNSSITNPNNHPQQQQYASPIQNTYLPQTPGSGGSLNHDEDEAQDGGLNDPKRPRACEACRGLKVRCEPDLNNLEGPCKRCAKANRNCVITAPSRKRQKKTDSRVAELEKKIDALTATLHAHKSGSTPTSTHTPVGQVVENTTNQEVINDQRNNSYQQVTTGGYATSFTDRPGASGVEWNAFPSAQEYENKKPSAPPMVVAGQKRKATEARDGTAADINRLSTDGRHFMSQEPASKPTQMHEYADVVDRGLLTADMAAKMFHSYVMNMAPHMPCVVFPPGTTSAEVRKTRPILFLSILSAASGAKHPDLQRVLTKEVMSIYAERVIMNGEKTLELVQALLVSTLWYWPPEHFEELKFYQLIHIAAVMAIDIGMGKKSKASKNKPAGLWRDHPWRRTPYPDPESIETRRTWLACYFVCCNASMGLRRPNLVRWTSFMAECVDVLSNSSDALPSDKILCYWVKSQQIAEEVGTQFSMDDPGANVSIADPKVQYALKGFERELDKWSNQIPPELFTPTLIMTKHLVNLYMHEVAMHVDHNVEEFKPPFTEVALRGSGVSEHGVALTPAHIDALSVCLTSIDGIFETFLSFDVETVRCLPVGNFVRVAYAVVVLIKMYFAAITPNSELGKVINKDNMRVEQYLDGLVDIFKRSAADEKSRPSAKFLMVLLMLKTWFHRQREGKPPVLTCNEPATTMTLGKDHVGGTKDGGNNPAAQGKTPGNGQTVGYGPANTPLQLLSEVATGNPGGQPHAGRMVNYQGVSTDWQQPQTDYQQYRTPTPTQNTFAQGFGLMPGGLDPAMDFNYSMGENFESAIGMALGASDFASYTDDAFFGSLLDSVGTTGLNFEGF